MIKIIRSKDYWSVYYNDLSLEPFLYDDARILVEDLLFVLECEENKDD